jgi:hypothetical protein
MRNSSAGYKHSDPIHLDYGRTADGSLLAKRKGFAEGGDVEDVAGRRKPKMYSPVDPAKIDPAVENTWARVNREEYDKDPAGEIPPPKDAESVDRNRLDADEFMINRKPSDYWHRRI